VHTGKHVAGNLFDNSSFNRAMQYSVKCGIAIACAPSVCDVGGSGPHDTARKSWKLIARTLAQHNTIALRSPKTIHLIKGEHGKISGRLQGVGKSGVLKHKSGMCGKIISETRKDREKVNMEDLYALSNGTRKLNYRR